MRFDALKKSLELNGDEDCSIYLILCIIKSLYSDVKKDTGANLDKAPIGDPEQLPVLLAYQCRMITQIYNSKIDELKEHRDFLENSISSVLEIEKQVDELAKEISDLSRKSEQVDELRKQYEKYKEEKEEYLKLQNEIERLRGLLSEARSVDVDEAKNEFNELNARYEAISAENQGLASSVTSLRAKIAEKETEKESLERSKSTLISDQGKLQLEISSITSEIESEEEEKACLEAQIDSLNKTKYGFIDTFNTLTNEIKTITSETDNYKNVLIPSQQANKKKQEKIRQLKKDELDELSAEIGSINEHIKELDEKRMLNDEKLGDLNEEMEALTYAVSKSDNEIAKMEEQLEELKNRSDADLLERRREQLKKSISEIQSLISECEELNGEIGDKEIEIQRLREERSNLNSIKERDEAILSEIREALKKLVHIATPDFESKLKEKEKALQSVKDIDRRLDRSLTMLAENLDVEEFGEQLSNEKRLKDIIEALDRRLTDLVKSFSECADYCSKNMTWRND